jgi:biopolymer transport protein ExbB/TolQ
MTYRATQLAAFLLAATALTIGSLAVMANIIEPLLAEPQAFHDFFFNRSPIQWVTLGVFFFSLSLLIHRVISHRRVQSELQALSAQRPLQEGTLVAQRFGKVQQCKTQVGPGAAANYNRELAEQDEEALDRVYGLLGNTIQLMLALGFFGTVWGISQEMFSAFGNLAGASMSDLKAMLDTFGHALSTALDTTILAIICALITSVLMAAMQWLETNAWQGLTGVVDHRLCLEFAAHSPQADQLALMRSQAPEIVQAMMQQIQAGMQPLLTDIVQVFETALQDVVQRQINRTEEHERAFFTQLAKGLTQQRELTVKALEAQGEQVRTALIFELQQISQQLQRAPEVSIRYPNATTHELSVQ